MWITSATQDPAHELATRHMSGFGSVIGFALESRTRAERFLRSSAERRGRWGLKGAAR